MASWWEFAKRHKGKLLVSSALIGGAIAASTLWEKQTTKFEEQPQNSELKLQVSEELKSSKALNLFESYATVSQEERTS